MDSNFGWKYLAFEKHPADCLLESDFILSVLRGLRLKIQNSENTGLL